MPGGDGTGPGGWGPMTGRAAGYCAGYPSPGFANPIPGRGYGYGYGRGMGFGFRGGRRGRWGIPYQGYGVPYEVPYYAPQTQEPQVDALRSHAQYLENALSEINKRIAQLENIAEKE